MIENEQEYQKIKHEAFVFMQAWHALKTSDKISDKHAEEDKIRVGAIEKVIHVLLNDIAEYEVKKMVFTDDKQ